MKKIVTLLFILLFILGFFSVFNRGGHYNYSTTVEGSNEASVFLVPGVGVADLKAKYEKASGAKKINLLLVPGHEPHLGGTEYGDLKEREMTVELAGYLNDFFKNNGRYATTVTRSLDSWNPILQNYFDTHWDDIKKFTSDQKDEMNRLISAGKFTKVSAGIIHNSAPDNVALRLYGINKWSNENSIDIALHIHFNDYPRKKSSKPGEYSGFAIYVPEKQYSNAASSQAIANAVFNRLENEFAVSDYPQEDGGVVEDQDLVAIGSRNSADAASMLIEYGYIYEPEFANDTVRHAILKEMAYQTYLGLEDFFGNGAAIQGKKSTTLLPSPWPAEITKETSNPLYILGLQAALTIENMYPVSETKNDCPMTGRFGPCTDEAITHFQKQYSILGEKGKAGETTLLKLNGLLNQK